MSISINNNSVPYQMRLDPFKMHAKLINKQECPKLYRTKMLPVLREAFLKNSFTVFN